MFLVYVGFELKTKKNLKKINVMNIFIDYYHQILTFFSRVGSVIFQEMAGVRGGCPILFFISSELLPRKIIWIKIRVEGKENCVDLRCCFSYICCIAAKSAGYVNNTLKNLYTAFCLFVWSLLTPGLISIRNNENKLCKYMHIRRNFSKKNWFQGNKIK